MIKKCPYCGKEFLTTREDKKFCSRACQVRNKRHIEMKERTCVICGTSFTTFSRNQKTCSAECSAENERRYFQELKAVNPKPKAKTKRRKTLDEISKEASACGLSYGQYKVQLKFGKTLEELKAAYDSKKLALQAEQ